MSGRDDKKSSPEDKCIGHPILNLNCNAYFKLKKFSWFSMTHALTINEISWDHWCIKCQLQQVLIHCHFHAPRCTMYRYQTWWNSFRLRLPPNRQRLQPKVWEDILSRQLHQKDYNFELCQLEKICRDCIKIWNRWMLSRSTTPSNCSKWI